MERVEKFLKEAETYYLATMEGDQPRVRPFGTIHIFDGKLYIQTVSYTHLDVYKRQYPYQLRLPQNQPLRRSRPPVSYTHLVQPVKLFYIRVNTMSYSKAFCNVYNQFGWNYFPEAFGEQLLTWMEQNQMCIRDSCCI